MNNPPVIFLMGATACGKTALSLSLAQALNAEIISVDSALVYRGLDVGTAKPSRQELATVPHHLIDICDPWEVYSAARFCHDALQIIEAIQRRGKRVLMVGGTMLYFKALEEGLAKLPDADNAVRGKLLQEAERLGWDGMHAQLQLVDPEAAARIHPNDPQRIQRALEVYRISGQPMSQLQADTRSLLEVPPIKFALVPGDRQWLHERIKTRFDMMITSGFIDEMHALRENALIHAELPAMRSVGYRQAWEHLELLAVNGASVENVDAGLWIDKAVAATRQLAKRQLTWIRGMKEVNTIACDTMSQVSQEEFVLSVLQHCKAVKDDSAGNMEKNK
ncbi:tRNA (adenosine(37)-N6)-dimethylallyltransferase MiaA [Granulosicoccus antarcticus]|uniref:tRNA (adenosine(37)-N6)-dimethylallyltransferase MiaA n=1 Tax=Granulosicoccus antarcticus TaxID=437505 RepID=UPI001F030BC1|nr:tRNA (adenosine(37)-N6)-dimethylallyltransferase MiaA [Granulosicoccus antarcticus]